MAGGGRGGDDDLYLVLEDDAVPADGVRRLDVERAASSLPEDWAYASLNVHESVCAEDAVGGGWFLKRSSSTLLGAERVARGDCSPLRISSQWADRNILSF